MLSSCPGTMVRRGREEGIEGGGDLGPIYVVQLPGTMVRRRGREGVGSRGHLCCPAALEQWRGEREGGGCVFVCCLCCVCLCVVCYVYV